MGCPVERVPKTEYSEAIPGLPWPTWIGDRARESAADHEWVDPAELGSYPHPSYVKKALRIAVDARG